MKSPNMMSTTGLMPVMDAPTAKPVMPASEIGVSITRSLPNSSTSPDRTLNGVPASATSSPMMNTRGSRRISSASASRMASPKVNSRPFALGIDMLIDLAHVREGRIDRKLRRRFDLGFHVRMNPIQQTLIGMLLIDQPARQLRERIAPGHPILLFVF